MFKDAGETRRESYPEKRTCRLLTDAAIVSVAKKVGKTPAQVCLRWCIQKGTVAIPKAGSEEHLKENIDIFNWQISEEDMKRLDSTARDSALFTAISRLRKRLLRPFY